jgi:hypothetical protein
MDRRVLGKILTDTLINRLVEPAEVLSFIGALTTMYRTPCGPSLLTTWGHGGFTELPQDITAVYVNGGPGSEGVVHEVEDGLGFVFRPTHPFDRDRGCEGGK